MSDLFKEEDKVVPIFVFGSNLAGKHGKGAAQAALKYHGAIYGQGEGLQGQSYAIPTKSKFLDTLTLWDISQSVSKFILFASDHPELTFELTPIGCGLAGYEPEDIAPFFRKAPSNVNLPGEFRKVLENIMVQSMDRSPRERQ